jgi:ATP-binding cassette, subfamily G (WHITE), member 2, SNQ2
MFGQQSDEMYRRRADRHMTQPDLHNILPTDGRSEEQSPQGTARGLQNGAGTWGERDVGGPVNTLEAYGEYEALRKELTNISLQRTGGRDSSATKPRASIWRSRSSMTRLRTASTARRPDDLAAEATRDTELGPDEAEVEDGDFALGEFLRDGRFEKRTPEGASAKKVGVVWKHLTVKGVGATVMFTKTLPDAVLEPLVLTCIA